VDEAIQDDKQVGSRVLCVEQEAHIERRADMVDPLQPGYLLLLQQKEKRISELDVLADIEPVDNSTIVGVSLEVVGCEPLAWESLDNFRHPNGAHQAEYTQPKVVRDHKSLPP
jgi:hypothetical protein